MSSLIAEDMREWFYLQRWLRTENHGRREVYGPLERHPCRWEPGERRAETPDGRSVLAQGTLWTSARVGLAELKTMRLWLPGDDPTDIGMSRMALQAFERKDLETGAFDHSELVL